MPALGALQPGPGAGPRAVRSGTAVAASPPRARHLPRWGWPLAALAALAVVISRRPDAVTNAQFWAEDGTVWFATAYNHGGFASLLTPYNGYLQVFSRLVAALFTPLGLRWAPLTFNLVAIAVQVAPALFLLTSRLDDAAPLPGRAALAAVYLLIPSFEVNANLTNAQWHLAVLATLVVVARVPRGRPWRAFDIAAVVLSALTGPFGFLLILVLGIRWLGARERWFLLLGGLCLLCDAVQVWAIHGGGRPAVGPLGATPSLLLEILANKVVLDGLFAQDWTHVVFLTPGSGMGFVSGLIDLVAAGVVVTALIRGPEALRLFTLVAAGVLIAGLASPLVATQPQWPVIDTAGVAQRYFLLAECAWLACLLWTLTRWRPRLPRRIDGGVIGVGLVLAAMAVGLATAWQYPPFQNDHPATYAARLGSAAPGSTFVEPINPPGWSVQLTVR